MKCPSANDWDLLAMEVLEGERAEGMLEHARTCPTCREQFQAARRAHIDRVRTYEAFDRDHDELREQLTAALPEELPRRSGATRLVRGWTRLGDVVMSMNKTTGRRAAAVLAPAACIVIAVVVLLSSQNGVAFAAVLERIRQARTMVCEVNLTVRTEVSAALAEQIELEEDAPPMRVQHTTRGKLSMYSDGITRAWLLEQSEPPMRQLTLPDRLIVTENGKHSVVKLTDDPNTPGYVESPETWLRRLLELADEPDRRLGEQVIDGQKVVGFEIAASRLYMGLGPVADDSGSVVRLWVGVETRLPLRLEFDVARDIGPTTLRLEGAWDRMRWDVPLDPQIFEPPPITEADEVKDLGLPAATEEALLAGLGAYAEQSAEIAEVLAAAEEAAAQKPEGAQMLAQMRQWIHGDSGYPRQLDLQPLALDVSMRSSVMRARLLAERAKRAQTTSPQEDEKRWPAEDEQLAREVDEISRAVGGAAMFYRKLVVEGREPEYFGQTVQPGDANAVLVRWKLGGGSMRVVYGDLRVETLSGSE